MHSSSEVSGSKAERHKPRYLLIFQDNLFARTPEIECDFIPTTGQSITPGGELLRPVRSQSILRIVARALLRKYDVIFLSSVALVWPYDTNPLKAKVRLGIRVAAHYLGWLLTRLWRLCIGAKTKLVLLDRYDEALLQSEFATVTSADAYFRTNIRKDDPFIRVQPRCTIHLLPYWIVPDLITSKPTTREEKEYDISFCAALNSDARRAALESLEPLRRLGIRIYIPEDRLSPSEYAQMLRRSWLVLSPQGRGYHGFRHYESMVAGAIPVINHPVPDVVTTLADGKNCLMYEMATPGDLVRVVVEALRDKDRLWNWGNELRKFALSHHTPEAVAAYLLEHAHSNDVGVTS